MLTLYCFFITIEKPFWAGTNDTEQHVFMMPTQIYIRSLLQTFLVCLKKTLWLEGSSGYSLILVIAWLLHLAFSIKNKPFNLEILNLWYFLAYCGLICVGLVSFLSQVLNAEKNPI